MKSPQTIEQRNKKVSSIELFGQNLAARECFFHIRCRIAFCAYQDGGEREVQLQFSFLPCRPIG